MEEHSGVTTLYLSGPMSGLPDFNFPAFERAAKLLREDGYNVLNPAENDNGSRDKDWVFYMRMDIKHVADADALVVLPGWENSRGAQIEVALAERLEMDIHEFHELQIFHTDDPKFELVRIEPRIQLKATLESESPAEEAYRLVRGDRRNSYGHPAIDYQRTAAIQSAILGRTVTPKESILNMIAVKLSREVNSHKRDNLVDICGYVECLQMVYEYELKHGIADGCQSD